MANGTGNNNDFIALILARLDRSKIRSDLDDIQSLINKKGLTAHIGDFTADVAKLVKTIQGELNTHKFTISVDVGKINYPKNPPNIPGGNSGRRNSGKAPASYSADAKKNFIGLEAAIASAENRMQKFANTGHSEIGKLEANVTSLRTALSQLRNGNLNLKDKFKIFKTASADLVEVNDQLKLISNQTNALPKDAMQKMISRGQSGFDAVYKTLEKKYNKLKSSGATGFDLTEKINGTDVDLFKNLKNQEQILLSNAGVEDKVEAYKEWIRVVQKLKDELSKAATTVTNTSAKVDPAIKKLNSMNARGKYGYQAIYDSLSKRGSNLKESGATGLEKVDSSLALIKQYGNIALNDKDESRRLEYYKKWQAEVQKLRDIYVSAATTINNTKIDPDTKKLEKLLANKDTSFKAVRDTLTNRNKKLVAAGATGLDQVESSLHDLKTAEDLILNSNSLSEKLAAYKIWQLEVQKLKDIYTSATTTIKKVEADEKNMLKMRDRGDIGFEAVTNSLKSKRNKLSDKGASGLDNADTLLKNLDKQQKIILDDTRSVEEQVAAYKEWVKTVQELRDTFASASTTIDPAFKKMQDMVSGGEDKFNIKISELQSKFDRTSFAGTDINVEDLKRDLESLSEIERKIFETNDLSRKLELWKEFENTAGRIDDKLKIAKNTSKAYVESFKAVKLDADIQDWLKKNTKATDAFGDEVKQLKDALDSLNSSSKDGYVNKDLFDNVNKLFNGLKSKAKSTGKTGLNFLDQLTNTFKKFSGFFSAAEVFSRAQQMLQEMYKNVAAVDKAMTDLYKVTDETNSRYDAFLKNATKTAQELGRTVSGYITQASEWAKLGYSLGESEELAKVSSIYANVGDIDDATAVGDMVTALKGFNIAATDAVTIVDSLNELSNNYAVTAADLGDGLSRSASAMNLAGNSMEQTLAMITGVTEITQNASEAGNFFKTATMRLMGKFSCPPIMKMMGHVSLNMA